MIKPGGHLRLVVDNTPVQTSHDASTAKEIVAVLDDLPANDQKDLYILCINYPVQRPEDQLMAFLKRNIHIFQFIFDSLELNEKTFLNRQMKINYLMLRVYLTVMRQKYPQNSLDGAPVQAANDTLERHNLNYWVTHFAEMLKSEEKSRQEDVGKPVLPDYAEEIRRIIKGA